MVRAEKRDFYRNCFKKLRTMTLGQFERFLTEIMASETEEIECAVEQALREEFGFGDKRIARLSGKIRENNEKRLANGNQSN